METRPADIIPQTAIAILNTPRSDANSGVWWNEISFCLNLFMKNTLQTLYGKLIFLLLLFFPNVYVGPLCFRGEFPLSYGRQTSLQLVFPKLTPNSRCTHFGRLVCNCDFKVNLSLSSRCYCVCFANPL